MIGVLFAISFFSSAFAMNGDKAYGWILGGAMLVILPLWLVFRTAERRGRKRGRLTATDQCSGPQNWELKSRRRYLPLLMG